MTERRSFWESQLFAGLAIAIGLGLVLFIVWPGQAKLTAPLLCDKGDDAFVLRDTFSNRKPYEENPTGTDVETRYSMWCLGPTGEAKDVGWMKPLLTLAAGWSALGAVGGTIATFVRPRRPKRDESPVSG